MGFFDVDYSNAKEQVEPGIYEVFVSDYTIGTSGRTGNIIVNLFYTVREDVPQPHQGAQIQYDNFTETDNSKWRWDAAAKAAGIPDKTPIQTANDWANLMVNRDLKIKVAMGEPNQNGNSYPVVKSFYNTGFPNQGRPAPQLKKAFEAQQRQTNINQAANQIAQNGYNQQPAYQQPPIQNGHNNFAPQNNTQQQTLPGVDPVADNRMNANNDPFSGSVIDISDDDLPF